MYYVTELYNDIYFFEGSIIKHHSSNSTTNFEGWSLCITGESFDKNDYYYRTRQHQHCEFEPIEITKEQFDMFKEEILKIQKLKDMFNTTAIALYKSKSNASNKELHTTL